MEIEDDSQPKPIGYYLFAESYRLSFETLMKSPPVGLRFDDPIRFLAYHAMELYLKAILKASGRSVAEMKKLGHKIPALVEASKAHGLMLDVAVENTLKALASAETIIDTRYLRLGYYGRPTLEGLSNLVNILRKEARRLLQDSGVTVR